MMMHPVIDGQTGKLKIDEQGAPMFYPQGIPLDLPNGEPFKDRSGNNVCIFAVLDQYSRPQKNQNNQMTFEIPLLQPSGAPMLDADKQPMMADLILGPDGNPTFDQNGMPMIIMPPPPQNMQQQVP